MKSPPRWSCRLPGILRRLSDPRDTGWGYRLEQMRTPSGGRDGDLFAFIDFIDQDTVAEGNGPFREHYRHAKSGLHVLIPVKECLDLTELQLDLNLEYKCAMEQNSNLNMT